MASRTPDTASVASHNGILANFKQPVYGAKYDLRLAGERTRRWSLLSMIMATIYQV
jgi:hypothetical protein